MIPGTILTAAAPLLRRYWPHLLHIAFNMALVCGAWLHGAHWGRERGAASRQPEITALTQTLADVRATAAAALQSDIANKARVEAEQDKVQSDAEAKLRSDLAAARAAVDRLRRTPTADPGRSGAADLPDAPDATGDAARASGDAIISTDDAMICSDNSIKAKAWRDWWLRVDAIERGGDGAR